MKLKNKEPKSLDLNKIIRYSKTRFLMGSQKNSQKLYRLTQQDKMNGQNFSNHKKYVKGFHGLLFVLLLLLLGSVSYLFHAPEEQLTQQR